MKYINVIHCVDNTYKYTIKNIFSLIGYKAITFKATDYSTAKQVPEPSCCI